MSKHTPGPWRYTGPYKDGTAGSAYEVEAEGVTVARLSFDRGDREAGGAAFADARLTAAAPELLRALKAAVAVERYRHNRSVEAASIHNNSEGVGQRFDYMSPDPLPVWVADAEAAIAKAEGSNAE